MTKRANITKRPYTYKGKTEERWLVMWTDLKGKRREKWFHNKRHAEIYAARIDRELADFIHAADRDTVTLAKAAEEYLKSIDQRHESRNRDIAGYTHRSYHSQIRNHVLTAPFAHLKLNKIRPKDVQHWVNELASKYKHRSVGNYYAHVINIFNFASKEQWLPRNFLLDHPANIPGKDKRRDDIPGFEEVRKLFAYLAGPRPPGTDHHSWAYYRAAISLAAFAGMRGGECAALQWSHIDWANNQISIENNRSDYDGDKDPKTEAGRRSVPMNPILRQALIEQFEYWRRPTEGYVLRGTRGGPILPHNVQQAFRAVMRGAGLTKPGGKQHPTLNPDGVLSIFTLHALRHFAVSAWLGSGMRIQDVQRHIGHKSIKTTIDTYGHWLKGDEHSREAIAKIANLFPGLPVAQIPTAASPTDAPYEAPRMIEAPPTRPVHAEELIQVGETVVGEDDLAHSRRAPENAPAWVQEALDLLWDGWMLIDVCRQVKRHRANVLQVFKRHGLAPPTAIRRAVMHARWEALCNAGYGDAEIAEKTGGTLHKVWEWRVRREGRGEQVRVKSLTHKDKYITFTKLKTGKERGKQLRLL
jgi:integrase